MFIAGVVFFSILVFAAGAPAQEPPASSRPLRIGLPDAQTRAAAAAKAAQLGQLGIAAARYHRQAAQADYFPKVGSEFYNLHFNKFMGQQIELLNRTAPLPLLNRDQSIFAVTVTQPVTPLFKVRQAVIVARADERIAQAKAAAYAAQVKANVERTYFALLIAQRQLAATGIKVRMIEGPARLRSAASSPDSKPNPQPALLEANQAALDASHHVSELTDSLDALIGLPAGTQLDLEDPPPVVETISDGPPPAQSIDKSPEVIEAQANLTKARAAARLAKLDYVPDVAGLWGYTFQTAIPLLPNDFSFVGFAASWNVFDFGKRERIVQERNTQVKMAEINLELVRAKAAGSAQKASLDLQRARRILELTRRVASLYRAMPEVQKANLDFQAAELQAEIEMFQAERDYRATYREFQRVRGEAP